MYFSQKESDRIQIVRVICTILVVFIHMNIENISLVNGTGNFAFPTWLHTIDYVIAECIGRALFLFMFQYALVF